MKLHILKCVETQNEFIWVYQSLEEFSFEVSNYTNKQLTLHVD